MELAVDGPTVEGDVSKPGEVDWYQFAVAKAGSHVVETTGGTDVVMSLHGPNKQTSIIAADDDSGRGLNARIVRELDPATYFVQVRHYGPAGTGGYKVGVKQSRRRRG